MFSPRTHRYCDMCADISHQPCTTREFMNFLLYIENSAENLQFYLWFRDYVKRFDQLPENEKNLSPPWVPEQSKPKIIHTKATSGIDMSPEEKRKAAQEVSQAIKGTDFDAKAKLTTNDAGHNPFNTPPRTPIGDKESMSPSMADWSDDGSTFFSRRAISHTKQSADAFETAKTLQPCKANLVPPSIPLAHGMQSPFNHTERRFHASSPHISPVKEPDV